MNKRKHRKDASWNRLPPGQLERLESWLLDEHLGYAGARERLRAEFGREMSIAGLSRFYRHRARERQAEEMVEAQASAEALNWAPVSAADLRTAAVKVAGKTALKLASERPEQWEPLVACTKLLLASEENDLRRGRLALAEKYFDYEAQLGTEKEWPQLRAYLVAVSDDTSLSYEDKIARVRMVLFGRDGSRLDPEKLKKHEAGN